jgi:very-short-patch-repair endonuclease
LILLAQKIKLAVEIDGSQHGETENVQADAVRTAKLERLGWAVLRFWNDDILRDIDGVRQQIVVASGLGDPRPTELNQETAA